MAKQPVNFSINYLDHVAIHVSDPDSSAAWYQNILGLKRITKPKWGSYPIYMIAGKTGIAIFPAKKNDPYLDPNSENIKIDHFAFNVSAENFEKAKLHLDNLNVPYTIRDHHYFHSLYLKDPDNHTVELTTLIVRHKTFYDE